VPGAKCVIVVCTCALKSQIQAFLMLWMIQRGSANMNATLCQRYDHNELSISSSAQCL
jgi:hypothetical protein